MVASTGLVESLFARVLIGWWNIPVGLCVAREIMRVVLTELAFESMSPGSFSWISIILNKLIESSAFSKISFSR